jgi:hypothetical protein
MRPTVHAMNKTITHMRKNMEQPAEQRQHGEFAEIPPERITSQ